MTRPSLSHLLLVLLSTTAVAGSGCSDDAGTSLKGPLTFDLAFDRVVVERQETKGVPVAMIVRYVKDLKNGSDEWPAKVVANFPVEQGKEKNILSDGSLSRKMINQVQFPEMERGKITFESLGKAGEQSCGKFFITFVGSKGTLNGEFCETTQLLSF